MVDEGRNPPICVWFRDIKSGITYLTSGPHVLVSCHDFSSFTIDIWDPFVSFIFLFSPSPLLIASDLLARPATPGAGADARRRPSEPHAWRCSGMAFVD